MFPRHQLVGRQARACIALCIALACLAHGVRSQRPSVSPSRLAPGVEIEVDGRLTESAWVAAARIEEFTEVSPIEGRAAELRTVVRLAYDRDFLYVALECHDDPAEVRARVMTRDANLDPDDRVELWLDTFDAQRSGYWFQIGAGGSRGDALMSAGGLRFNKSWDGIWYGRSRITERGWQAELAFPFKTLGFREGGAAWGFNVRRFVRSRGVELRWASPLQAYRFFDLRVGGALVGMQGLRQGIGLDVIPYAKFAASRDRRGRDHTSRTGDFGLDVKYRITPSLALQLTYNTDFAETEVDARRVNLTRFPLFFPEKRDFFLQDSDLFDFGLASGFGGSTSVLPFFSRRIGRDAEGSPLPLLAGAKLAGRVGDWNVGALGTLVEESALDPDKALGVVRVAHNLGEESAVGVLATGGRPAGRGSAATGGVDFRLADSEFFGVGHSAAVSGYWVASQNEGVDDDGAAWALQARTRSRSWSHVLETETIERGFDPQLGFVRRTATRRYELDSDYTWRSENGGAVREVRFSLDPEVTTTIDHDKDMWRVSGQARVELESLDTLSWRTQRRFERVPEAFELREGIAVAAGDYTDSSHRLSLSTSEHRPLALQLSGEAGDFFSGNLTRTSIEPEWIPSRYLRVAGEYEEVRVRLDSGRFTTRVTEGRVDLNFSPEVSWRNLVQYDTESRDLTLQTRVRWILDPGQDVFLLGVYGWNREVRGGPLIPTTQDFTVKLAYTVRF